MRPNPPRAATDPALLASSAYATDTHLTKRQNLYAYQHPTYDLPGLVLDQIADRTGYLADLGCGNGHYLDRIRHQRPDLNTLGLDISPGLLGALTPPVICADAAHLPITDASVDIVLAMHMLYHLPDTDHALAELARITRPGGLIIASTNAEDDKHEIDDLWATAAGDVLGRAEGPRRIKLSTHFPLDAGATSFRAHFTEVETHEITGTITLTHPDPLLAHLESYRSWAHTAGVPFDATLHRVAQRLNDHLERQGAFTITTRQGILTAHPQ